MKRTFLLVISLALYSCSAPPHHDVNEPPGESAMSRAYTAFAIQDMARIPEGMEVAWQRVRVYDPHFRTVQEESETGQMDNHIYQRAARPWTWLGSEEPYIYEYRLVSDVSPSGHEIEVTQIVKTPNVSPAARDEAYEMEPPQVFLVSADLDRHMYEDEEGMVRIPVSMLVKGVSRWNRPLRPRPEAGEAEQQMVRQSQLDYDRNRQLEIEQVTAEFRRELEELGAVHVSITGSNGWILADIPVEKLENLSSDVRLAAISPAKEENVDNACKPEIAIPPEPACFFMHWQNSDITQEWFLGEGARTQRFDAQQFYNLGIDGSYNQGPHNSLAVGVWEMGLYEDEAFFDKHANGVSRAVKFNCTTENSVYACRSPVNNNLPDVEASCASANTDQQRWERGCHGTGVASIAIGQNHDVLMNGHQLGDWCWQDVVGQPEHCPTLAPRSLGMAHGSTLVYVASWNHGTSHPVTTLMDQQVDVINMSFGPGSQTHPGICNPMFKSEIQSRLEDAFEDGIFLVSSTGNFNAGPNFSKDQCLTNRHATLPMVFAVAGVLNRTYHYGRPEYAPYWESGYDSTKYPVSPDDYWNMRVNPLASQTGGATLKINNQDPFVGAMTVVDLVAPEGGYNATRPEEPNGELNEFFGGSSGAAPHVSGLSMLVKHHFLQIGFHWLNFPGWLHTVMLAMGDRSFWSTHLSGMFQKTSGGDRVYGFGKIKLRRPLAGHFRPISKTWTAGNFPANYYAERIWPNPSFSSHKFVKGVMNQIERMDGKSPDDMVSDLWIQLAQTNQTYVGTCPATYEAACVQNGNSCIYRSDTSRDVKKMVQRYTSSGLAGRCHYVKVYRRHITSDGATVQMFFYRMGMRDHENSN